MKKIHVPGILLCFIIASAAYALGKVYPIIGGPVFGILFGILIITLSPNLLKGRLPFGSKPVTLTDGVQFTSKKLLQLAIILLGFEMNLFIVAKVGRISLYVMLFTLSAAFVTAWLAAKALKVPSKMGILIGVGTAICGGSAIAATAPVIQANDDEVAHAISTIFLFNIVAVFIFPPLGHLLGLGDQGFGIWAGTAVNDTSSVVAAATAWSNAVGNNTALAFATVVKLTRTLMIIPITLALGFYTVSKQAATQTEAAQTTYSFKKIFPWFVLGFLASACLNTTGILPVEVSTFLGHLGKFFIVMAMSAIGLNTNLKKLVHNGVQPIVMGLCCWFSVAAVSLVVQRLMNLWH